MANEELAALIQTGERERVIELWEQVYRFTQRQARRWALALEGRCGVTLEDLQQCAFLALLDAVDGFDPGRGMSFMGWYALHLKAAFTEATGQRTQKARRDPMQGALSLDAPLTDSAGDPFTIADTIPDAAAEAAILDVDERDRRKALHAALCNALQRLTEDQQEVIRCRYYRDLTMDQTGRPLGMTKSAAQQTEQKALRVLRHPANSLELRALWAKA